MVLENSWKISLVFSHFLFKGPIFLLHYFLYSYPELDIIRPCLCHADLVVGHRGFLDHLGGRVAGDPVRDVLLMLLDQLVEHAPGVLAEEVLLHLNLLALPLFVVLA